MTETTISLNTLNEIRLVTKKLAEARIRAEERAKATHERFNVFTTLRSSSDEVRLHTRFLHCLLDPHGFHDCGSLFLDLFFDTLEEMPGMDHNGTPTPLELTQPEKSWTVEKEASRPPYGQIDLLLERPGFGIAIENKIYASEQENQLGRYASYLGTRYKKTEAKVLYLTINGKESFTHDGGDVSYLRISYADHILAWLEKCLRETYCIIPVNQVLLQYRNVVRELTGRTMESATMQNIAEFIYEHPDIIRYQKQLNEGIALVQAMVFDRLAAGIIDELKHDNGYDVRLRPNLVQGRFGADGNGALIIKPLKGALSNVPFEIWVEHIAKWEGIVVGIESKYGKAELSPENKQLLEKMNLILVNDSNARDYHKATPQASWGGTYWPTGWHNLRHFPGMKEEMVAEFIETPHQTVSKMCGDIRSHIKLLEKVYDEVKSAVSTLNS